jgi:tetratricopeptide (TPR) repeat protein
MSDILKLESEIAQTLASEISVQVTDAEQQRLGNSKSIDARSAEAVLLGKHFFNMWTAESEQKAIEQFQKAVDIEPNYADAWAGLADAWTASAMNGNMRMSEARDPTKNATAKALSIDPDNSAGNVSMCFVENNYDFDWAAGEKACRRGIELDPNNSKAHFAYAFMLARLERWDDMAAQMDEAMRVDPVQPWWPAVYADWLTQAHRYNEVPKLLDRALEIDPNWEMAKFGRMNLYIALGKYDEALKLADIAQSRARIYAAMGDRSKALGLLQSFPDDHYTTARVYAALGDNDKAFEILNTSLDEGDGFMGPAASYTEFDKLHSDPRWKDLMRRMNR